MNKIPVIIDTDPGVDDFMAIMLANSSEKLDIRAITAVAGNQTLEKTSKNAMSISEFLGMDTRVAKGAEKPLNKELEIAEKVHGDSGIGPVVLPTPTKVLDNDYAWDVIYQEALKAEGKLNIIAIGPLTNLAIAFLKYEDLHKHIEKITIMGGSTGVGNVRPYSEFNIWIDPLAADIVFKAGVPITMVGLDVTMKAVLNPELAEEVKKTESKYQKEVGLLIDHLAKTYKGFGYDFVAIHDALAVASIIRPEVLECKEFYVTVETRKGLNEGRTVVDLDRTFKTKSLNAKVALNANNEIFIEMLKDMMRHYK